MAAEKSSSRSWMSDAAIYQIYPRSFKDSTGSGLGDIAGITQQMDYLERLGIETIWLSPFTLRLLSMAAMMWRTTAMSTHVSARLTTSMT
mgnify:FL=1